jgi:glycosyltransferase involved in cell wall biosynthesis
VNKAVDELNKEGLKVELVLLEKIPNSRVRELMQEVDILAEQFIGIGYALSGMEGMASGLPVLANLDNETYTTIFRRYSFLNECPILSTTPETLKENLRLLVTNPDLRKELGELGRKYAEKYHSYEMAQYLFTHIFRKLDGEDIDLMNLFHPLKSEYVKNNYIKTPLINNKYIPKEEI